MVFEWSDKFLTGIKIVDEQHRGLLVLINQLSEATMKGYGPGQVRAEKAFDELVSYALLHFDTEEQLMDTEHYPRFNLHRLEHDSFKAQLAEYRKSALRNAEQPSIEILNFLIRWVNDHILAEDITMGEHLRSRGLK